MNLLLDTNILLYITRDESEHKLLDFINPMFKDIPLVTTDSDFDHLHEIFINLCKIAPTKLKSILQTT